MSANVRTYVSAIHSLVKLSVCLSLSHQLHTSAFHLSCTGKAELVGGHGHRGGGWVQTWYFQPCGNFSSWLELCTNPCGGYRLRLLGTQRSAQPKFCQLESFICMELEFLRLRAQNATSHFSPARLLYSAPYFRPPLHYSS